MGTTYRINLADIPWPVSILKCNQMLDALEPDEVLDLTLTDGDVFKNLMLLFGSLPDTELLARHTDAGYEVQLTKKAQRRVGATD